MMDPSIPDIALRAAAQLAPTFGPTFAEEVERVIVDTTTAGPPRRFLDPALGLAAASLLVSLVQLAVQLYQVKIERHEKLQREDVAAAARQLGPLPSEITQGQCDLSNDS